MSKHRVLVTGAAGFIGFHVAQHLLQAGHSVVGLDSLNAYYDPKLKEARLSILKQHRNFIFSKIDLADRGFTKMLFAEHRFPVVIHLAAQAGVRYSLENAPAYIDANLEGFANVLEGCRHNDCRHLIYASSSSVYGANTKLPFSVHDNVDHPISLYAATKKANELMAHSYSHLYGLPTTGLRFFTVYGPWGRPDMAMFLFAKAIVEGQPIRLFNNGDMQRDFTYIDDITEAVVRLIDHVPTGDKNWSSEKPDPSRSAAPWRIFNIGNNRPERLTDLVAELEKHFGPAKTTMLPMQPGDVYATYADIDDLTREVGFRPSTSLQDGVAKFAAWFRDYHKR
ncbi:MAG: NAD-dependent epimerase [Rhizobiales bacterium]|nr:NAD-dependent epimerase [Hyphomicrobiales bacterium]